MKISQLPQEVKEKALENQRNAVIGWDKKKDDLVDAFDWEDTKEGYDYWRKWYKKDFIELKNYLDFISFEDLDNLLSWKISQNHTKN
jgi:hypothetical protein